VHTVVEKKNTPTRTHTHTQTNNNYKNTYLTQVLDEIAISRKQPSEISLQEPDDLWPTNTLDHVQHHIKVSLQREKTKKKTKKKKKNRKKKKKNETLKRTKRMSTKR
jgi:hypothetical protein